MNTDLLKRLAILQKKPELAEILPQAELIAMMSQFVSAFEELKKAIETNKLKGDKGEPGVTPQAGKDYPSYQQVETAIQSYLAVFETNFTTLEKRAQLVIEKVRDGKDAEITQEIKDEIADAVRALIELPDFDQLVELTIQARPDLVRNGLETITKEEDKLSIDAIGYLREELDRLDKKGGVSRQAGAIIARRLDQIGDVNLNNPTNGQALVYNAASKQWENQNVTGSGSVTVEIPTGTVNSANVNFTVTQEPKWIVSDGITYFENFGYSRSGLNITMDTPPTLYLRAIL